MVRTVPAFLRKESRRHSQRLFLSYKLKVLLYKMVSNRTCQMIFRVITEDKIKAITTFTAHIAYKADAGHTAARGR